MLTPIDGQIAGPLQAWGQEFGRRTNEHVCLRGAELPLVSGGKTGCGWDLAPSHGRLGNTPPPPLMFRIQLELAASILQLGRSSVAAQ